MTADMTSLPHPLPDLTLTPGPVLAAPLPADRPVRWGVMATGNIAGTFAGDLRLLDECAVAAVASRRQESADAFAAEHGIATAYGDYRSLAHDPDVDVVYVATPHGLHREHVELVLDAGKAVLCEKPLTLNAREAEELVAMARGRGLFLMEAMWMRTLPVMRRLRQLVASGALGEVRQVRADLGFVVDRPPEDRLLDPALGAGALLDMGVYPMTFADLFLGEPDTVTAVAGRSDRGIDLDFAVGLGYAGGAVASLTASMTSWSPRTASVATDRGRLELPAPFHHPASVTWTPFAHGPGGGVARAAELVSEPEIGRGYTHQALEVVRCLRAGEIESPLVPLDTTVAMMRRLDRVREVMGVRYPADEGRARTGGS